MHISTYQSQDPLTMLSSEVNSSLADAFSLHSVYQWSMWQTLVDWILPVFDGPVSVTVVRRELSIHQIQWLLEKQTDYQLQSCDYYSSTRVNWLSFTKTMQTWFLVDVNSGFTGKNGTVCLSLKSEQFWLLNQTEKKIHY